MGRQVSMARWVAALMMVLLLLAAGALFLRRGMQADRSPSPAPVLPATTSAASVAHPVQHPIGRVDGLPASASTAPLPALNDSDDVVATALARLAGDNPLASLLVRPQIIARIVASVDAMPGRSLGGSMRPARTPKGAFAVQQVGGKQVISEDNAARYAPYMLIIEQVNPQALVAWYVHAYPLFQQAYRQLGYPHGYFNDRLIVVIDDLLGAPEPSEPALVQRVGTRYLYADPALEARSAGQRLMLRTGWANERKIKARLRVIRSLLLGQHLDPAAAATSAGVQQ